MRLFQLGAEVEIFVVPEHLDARRRQHLLIQEKCRNRLLVVVAGTGRQEVYWNGALVTAGWRPRGRAWTLLVELADKVRLGQGMDAANDLGICTMDPGNWTMG